MTTSGYRSQNSSKPETFARIKVISLQWALYHSKSGIIIKINIDVTCGEYLIFRDYSCVCVCVCVCVGLILCTLLTPMKPHNKNCTSLWKKCTFNVNTTVSSKKENVELHLLLQWHVHIWYGQIKKTTFKQWSSVLLS
jgi:hypothetical protein